MFPHTSLPYFSVPRYVEPAIHRPVLTAPQPRRQRQRTLAFAFALLHPDPTLRGVAQRRRRTVRTDRFAVKENANAATAEANGAAAAAARPPLYTPPTAALPGSSEPRSRRPVVAKGEQLVSAARDESTDARADASRAQPERRRPFEARGAMAAPVAPSHDEHVVDGTSHTRWQRRATFWQSLRRRMHSSGVSDRLQCRSNGCTRLWCQAS